MTRRDRMLKHSAQEVRGEEQTLWIGHVVSDTNGELQVTVNGRPAPRSAVFDNDFAFATKGRGSRVGEHVILVASERHDMAFAVGSSTYILGGDS